MDNHFTGIVKRPSRISGLGFFIVLATLGLPGCTSTEAVAAFADNAQKALQQGPALFRDIHDSCIRRHADAQPITALYLPRTSEGAGSPSTGRSDAANQSAVCTPFASQGDALTSAVGILASYFGALQQLAAFDTSTVSTPAQRAAESAGYGAKFTVVQTDSLSKLAGFIGQAFTEKYRRHSLTRYLREADPSVASVTKGFEDIVSQDYKGLLAEEQQTLTARYQNVGDINDRATILLLNRAYLDDLNALTRRKAAADAFVEALQQIRAGHHELAQNVNRLRGKELSLALHSYTIKLQALTADLQKGL